MTIETDLIFTSIYRQEWQSLKTLPIKWFSLMFKLPIEIATYILVNMCGYKNRNGVCIPPVTIPTMLMKLRIPRINALGHYVLINFNNHSFRREIISTYYILSYMKHKHTNAELFCCGTFYRDEYDNYVIWQDMYRITSDNAFVHYSPVLVHSIFRQREDYSNFNFNHTHTDKDDDYVSAFNYWRMLRIGKQIGPV